jgi:hypothetical protein
LFLSASAGYADPVTLNNGSTVTIASNQVMVSLTGVPGFSMFYHGDIPPGTSFAINTAFLGAGSATFNGITSINLRGFGSFNSNLFTGGFSAYSDLFFTTPPLFSVEFSAFGFVVVTNVGGVQVTTFTVATPEPGTYFLLAAGLIALMAGRRLRTNT